MVYINFWAKDSIPTILKTGKAHGGLHEITPTAFSFILNYWGDWLYPSDPRMYGCLAILNNEVYVNTKPYCRFKLL